MHTSPQFATIFAMLPRLLLLVALAGVVSAADSPLVALSKRTNRKASKTPVITNHTLASRARLAIATTETTEAAPATETAAPTPPPATTPSAPTGAKVTVAGAGPGYSSTTVRNIAPSSSAQTVAPQSTGRALEPASGARTVAPQATAPTVQPQSTARTVDPTAQQPPR